MARKKIQEPERYPGVRRGLQNGAGLNEAGAETFDNEPLVLRVRGRVINDMDRIRSAIQNLRATEDGNAVETFEEADDFDVDDDFGEFSSQHEILADHDELHAIIEPAIKQARRPRRAKPQDPPAPSEPSAPSGQAKPPEGSKAS